MAIWDTSDIDREASELARIFWAGQGLNGTPLNELATKVAKDHALNPEQVRRLCRATNTKAFEQKFASLKGEADRAPSFPLADAEDVIRNLFQQAETSMKTAAQGFYPELENELNPPPPAPLEEKLAFVQDVDSYLAPPRAKIVELQRLEKTARDLMLEKQAQDFAWSDAMARLHELTTFLDWDHAEFEKNAVALFGGNALPELDGLRQLRKMPVLGGANREGITDKLASLKDRWVGAPTPATQLLKQAMTAREAYSLVATQLTDHEQRLATLQKTLRHG